MSLVFDIERKAFLSSICFGQTSLYIIL